MKKYPYLLLFIFIFSSSLSIHAQTTLDKKSLAISYLANGQYDKCIKIANNIIEKNGNTISSDESIILITGALSYHLSDNPLKAKEMVSVALEGLSYNTDLEIQQFKSFDKEKQKKILKSQLQYFECISYLYLCMGNGDVDSRWDNIFTIFHTSVANNKYSIFDKTNIEDALYILQIIAIDEPFHILNGDLYHPIKQGYPEIVALTKSVSPSSNVQHTIFYTTLRDILKQYESYIGISAEFEYSNEKKYRSRDDQESYGWKIYGTALSEITDFYLQESDLAISLFGSAKSAKHFADHKWTEVQGVLKDDECAVIMVTVGDSYGVISIPPKVFGHNNDPLLFFVQQTISPHQLIEALHKKYKNKKILFKPIDEWETLDIAYCDSLVYLKRNLMDIIQRNDNDNQYNNGMVNIFADIDYGKPTRTSNTVRNLTECSNLIRQMKHEYGEKVHFLTGENVKKINFMNITNDVEIFHISTHGLFLNNYIPDSDNLALFKSLMGFSSMKKSILALSGYNESEMNSISGYDIGKMDFVGCELIFLDACLSASTASNYREFYGMAKSFYGAGAKKIIAYTNKINEKVAIAFSTTFYKELLNSTTKNYHDVFYKTKQMIIQKYQDDLNLDQFGNYDIGIVLWE